MAWLASGAATWSPDVKCILTVAAHLPATFTMCAWEILLMALLAL